MKSICLFMLIFVLSLSAASNHHEVYFQQYVRYNLDVSLDIDLKRLDVNEVLLYKNNSPDTLRVLYFHLYMNAFKQQSLSRPDNPVDAGYITVHEIIENDSVNINALVDETIMKLDLHHPLPPGYYVRLKFDFSTVLPRSSGRLGYQGDHFDVGNWYVTPVVYDRAGWHLNQHLDNEYYQEWGDFNVNIRLPRGFLAGATGNLLNPHIAYRDTLPEFSNHYLLHPEDTSRTIWKYEARQVHDFAWTADPGYKLMQAEWNGITFNVLAMDFSYPGWKKSGIMDWGVKALAYMHENFGAYPYDQITVADTYIQAGGIEYPQITFINDLISPDFRPDHFKAVVIHEMAHNWYYGLLANNQTEEEWLDEGFTTFAEIKTMEALFGSENNYLRGDQGRLYNRFLPANDDRRDAYNSYLRLAKTNFDYDPIDLHADYLGQGAYVLQYSKMAAVLFMLEYTMGDSLFAKGLLNYYDRWKFKHPYPPEMIASFEEVAERDLDWFFEQWVNTNRKLDYAVSGISGQWDLIDGKRKYRCEIHLKRLGEIFMPVDFDVKLENGETKKYHIPVDAFAKYEKDRQVLEYWHFSKTDYWTEIELDSEPDKVIIDPSKRLLDINRLNNTSGIVPEQEFHFMKFQSWEPPIDKYIWELWPTLAYNDVDNFKPGMNLKGSYLNLDHKLDIWSWYKIKTNTLDFSVFYKTPKEWLGSLTSLNIKAFTLDGRQGMEACIVHLLDKNWREQPRYKIEFGFRNHKVVNQNYSYSPWSSGDINTIYFTWNRSNSSGWRRIPESEIAINFNQSAFSPNHNFSQFNISAEYFLHSANRHWQFQMRYTGGYGTGNIPIQYLNNLCDDTGWGYFENSWYRSKGSLPYPLYKSGNLVKNGGGNVRGYSLYRNKTKILAENISAINLELEMPNPLWYFFIPVIKDIKPAIFYDTGTVWSGDQVKFASLKSSTGLSLLWEPPLILDYLFNLQDLRLDFPVWMSTVPDNEKNFDFRWLVSLNFAYDD